MRDPENEAYDAGYDSGRRDAEARFDGAHAALIGRLKTAETMRDALLKAASEAEECRAPSPIVLAAPPSGRVPEVTEADVAHFLGGCSYDPDIDCRSCENIRAAVEYCAAQNRRTP